MAVMSRECVVELGGYFFFFYLPKRLGIRHTHSQLEYKDEASFAGLGVSVSKIQGREEQAKDETSLFFGHLQAVVRISLYYGTVVAVSHSRFPRPYVNCRFGRSNHPLTHQSSVCRYHGHIPKKSHILPKLQVTTPI